MPGSLCSTCGASTSCGGSGFEPRADAAVTQAPDALVLGSLTTYADLRRSPLVAEHLPVLAEARLRDRRGPGPEPGHDRRATSRTPRPAGDTLPLLLATDASIVVGSVRGERRIPAAEFFTGYRRTARATDELILRVRDPAPARTAGPLPQGRHPAGPGDLEGGGGRVVARDGAPATARPGGYGSGLATWRDVRVALGSVAPVPVRARATEAVLEGHRPTREIADRAAAAVVAEITPIDDVRSTAAYRRAVTARVLRRIIRDAGGW